eukprot:10644813-Heterocapsa_arctica.AAC.1
MHAFNLETGSSARLQSYCASIASVTTDMGVEFSLSNVHSASYLDLFQWAVDENPLAGHGEDAGLDDVPDIQDAQVHVTLRGSLAIPGLMHFIHNAGNSLLTVMKTLDGAIDRLAE